MILNNLKPPKGATKRRKRVGCGDGSGHGGTSCRGHKGQNARSGGGVRPGFEGGQMPLIRRIPKRGFNSHRHVDYFIINLEQLDKKFAEGDEVTLSILKKAFKIKLTQPVKILSDGEISKRFKIIEANKFSKKAKEKLEKAGIIVREVEL